MSNSIIYQKLMFLVCFQILCILLLLGGVFNNAEHVKVVAINIATSWYIIPHSLLLTYFGLYM